MLPNKVNPLLLLLAVFLISSCNNEPAEPAGPAVTFRALGLDQRIVHKLELVNTTLFAATDAGLYSKNLAAEEDWQLVGMADEKLTALVAINASTLLAATANLQEEKVALYRSTDSGQSWQELNSNWSNGGPEPLLDLYYNPVTYTLYASGYGVVAQSADQGLSWTPIYGEWQSLASGLAFVAINPETGDIWTGGQNAIEGFRLAKKPGSDSQWQEWGNLLPSPSVAKSIAFHPNDPQTLLIGGEDGIIRTTNNGSSWTIVKQDHLARFYFGLAYDPQIPNRVYAASWDKNFDDPQPLLLHISNNGGSSWQEYRHEAPGLFGGAWDMVQRKEGETSRLYLGLYKGGVYEVSIE